MNEFLRHRIVVNKKTLKSRASAHALSAFEFVCRSNSSVIL